VETDHEEDSLMHNKMGSSGLLIGGQLQQFMNIHQKNLSKMDIHYTNFNKTS
jgi:hypothetical protein